MRTNLAVLCGALLLVAACESTPEESAEGSGQGATTAPPPPAVESSAEAGQGEVAAVQPAMSLQDQLVQEVGDRVFFDFDKSTIRSDGEATLPPASRLLAATREREHHRRGALRRTRHPRVQSGARRASGQRDQELLGFARNRRESHSSHLLRQGASDRARPQRIGLGAESSRYNRPRKLIAARRPCGDAIS